MNITVFRRSAGEDEATALLQGSLPVRAPLLFTLGLTALVLAATSSPSRADFRVCNATGAETRLAFGYNDGPNGWTSRGWWTMPNGTCQTMLTGNLPRGYYYVYATDEKGSVYGAPESQASGAFCIQRDKFELRTNNYLTPAKTIACDANGLIGARFRAVEIPDSENYTHTIVSSMASVPAAVRPPVAAQASPAPAVQIPIVSAPLVVRPAPPAASATACQRYPNLC
jgi:uncharacterized membrane protein